MVLIPSGEFNMGKNSSNPTDWQPEHKVHIDSFYMDKYEVTNKQYYEFCKETNNPLPEFWGQSQFKCSLEYPDHPVVGVSCFDADKYARWAGKRLSTEAEWEWTSDFYGDDYYINSPNQNPKGPVTGRFKVIRGGSWHSGAMCVQTYYRNGLSPSWVDFAVGFRCVKSVK